MLAAEVLLVFASTMVRSIFNTSSMMWVDEVSPLFLVNLAFLGGAVSYGRGQFIAITLLVERAPRVWNGMLKAFAEWLVIGISLLIGGYSVPLLIANAEEKSLLLGISYVWMTMPITLGSRAVRDPRDPRPREPRDRAQSRRTRDPRRVRDGVPARAAAARRASEPSSTRCWAWASSS